LNKIESTIAQIPTTQNCIFTDNHRQEQEQKG